MTSSSSSIVIKNILKKYQDGEMVLMFYESKQCLNSAMRNKLVAVIIKDQIQNNENLNRTRFIELAKGIEDLFPSETEELYFIPYCKEGNIISPNRGKLYDKFCNIKKDFTKISGTKRKHLDGNKEFNLNDLNDEGIWHN
ncbi:uncharacterized protein LOC132934922 [Metopolophium dirhodum]|uniref:uncharacterized protein LOC132934922 n=1 Tax=Metopolophium dirhodum TaxID=44670 RepID=UPI0029901686|nr:uncharacterized protein LOC132934922 [Metopolophium dirhodum]